ncbi:FAD-binding oxidoreductase [Promicromonospora iranensis]|uniref:FAD/FMN-containing dehydrogenase n=1 Tax=Promicromonospora iranensis TaxID=1105144 RepID=A0ABU2CTM7_9MICO|nr:FAD-binding oxidoreductase [Promicromonospora iranensis]MDR7384686.1 FAD/FMN-containing dehydrogenase [Promicromonospora iranensis]
MATQEPSTTAQLTAHALDSALAPLAAALGDRLLTPAAAGFADTAAVFVGGPTRTPAAVARVRTADEVATALAVARETGLPLAVRSGGHHQARHGLVDGGLVLDLRLMDGVDIDPAAGVGHAGGGVLAGAYTAAAGAHGLATGFGDTATVGVGGITLGGGIGYLSRRDGLTVDNLLGAEVVLADGSVVEANAGENPDLYWALRGGGGNFGVVTRLDLRLRELGTVTGGMMMWAPAPATLATVLRTFAEGPDEFAGMVNVMVAPPVPMIPAELHGTPIIMALLCHSGTTAQADEALAPLRALGPVFDGVQELPYPAMFEGAGGPPPGGIGDARTGFLGQGAWAPDEAWAADVIAAISGAGGPAAVNIRAMGGAIGRVDPAATAFAHRDPAFMVTVGKFAPAVEALPAASEWVTAKAEELGFSGRGYVNFMGTATEQDVRNAYPEATLARLREVKRTYDPGNLFASNHNVTP